MGRGEEIWCCRRHAESVESGEVVILAGGCCGECRGSGRDGVAVVDIDVAFSVVVVILGCRWGWKTGLSAVVGRFYKCPVYVA